jgi:glycosyltransferase involved in cell wall biosynthesis
MRVYAYVRTMGDCRLNDTSAAWEASVARAGPARGRLLYVVTEDWYFWSHRRALAAAAMAAGWQVALATRVSEHHARIAQLGVQVFPVEWDRGGLNPWRELRTARQLAPVLREFKPDIVHNVALKPILHSVCYARGPAVVNAVTGLGYVFIEAGEAARARLLRGVVRTVLRRALKRRGAQTVVQNKDDAQLLRNMGVTPRSMHLIEGVGIDLADYVPQPEPPGPVRVALVARMLWDKGVGEMVEAARLLRARGVNVSIELVGGPDPANRASVTEVQLREWHAAGLVQWSGWVEDVRSVWARAHIAALPSYREGFPKALIEAAACGRALIATDVPGCRAIVEPGINGELVPRADGVALADAIERLVVNADLRRSYGLAARRSAEQRFSLPVIAAQFGRLYDTMASQ